MFFLIRATYCFRRQIEHIRPMPARQLYPPRIKAIQIARLDFMPIGPSATDRGLTDLFKPANRIYLSWGGTPGTEVGSASRARVATRKDGLCPSAGAQETRRRLRGTNVPALPHSEGFTKKAAQPYCPGRMAATLATPQLSAPNDCNASWHDLSEASAGRLRFRAACCYQSPQR
jgi:hypothetical protein